MCDRLPLVLIPTTAGTGSEATPVSVVTVAGAEKRGVSSPALVADWAILDAALTPDLPRDVAAATGIEPMVPAIEAYTSARPKNPLSELLASHTWTPLPAHTAPVCVRTDDTQGAMEIQLGAHTLANSLSK